MSSDWPGPALFINRGGHRVLLRAADWSVAWSVRPLSSFSQTKYLLFHNAASVPSWTESEPGPNVS